MLSRRCIDCDVVITKRVTYSSEYNQVASKTPRCGKCYLRSRRSFRFRQEVKLLCEQIGTDLVAALVLEEES